MPLRSAMKPIITGMTTGSNPTISSRTPDKLDAVTTPLRMVLETGSCVTPPFSKSYGCGGWNRTSGSRRRILCAAIAPPRDISEEHPEEPVNKDAEDNHRKEDDKSLNTAKQRG